MTWQMASHALTKKSTMAFEAHWLIWDRNSWLLTVEFSDCFMVSHLVYPCSASRYGTCSKCRCQDTRNFHTCIGILPHGLDSADQRHPVT